MTKVDQKMTRPRPRGFGSGFGIGFTRLRNHAVRRSSWPAGTIDTSAQDSTASLEVFGLPPGSGYLVEFEATDETGTVMCKGDAEFEVKVGVATDVMVMINCKRPTTLGGVRVNGQFNICAQIAKVVVPPLQTSAGNDIDLFAAGAVDEKEVVGAGGAGDVEVEAAHAAQRVAGRVEDRLARPGRQDAPARAGGERLGALRPGGVAERLLDRAGAQQAAHRILRRVHGAGPRLQQVRLPGHVRLERRQGVDDPLGVVRLDGDQDAPEHHCVDHSAGARRRNAPMPERASSPARILAIARAVCAAVS